MDLLKYAPDGLQLYIKRLSESSKNCSLQLRDGTWGLVQPLVFGGFLVPWCFWNVATTFHVKRRLRAETFLCLENIFRAGIFYVWLLMSACLINISMCDRFGQRLAFVWTDSEVMGEGISSPSHQISLEMCQLRPCVSTPNPSFFIML